MKINFYLFIIILSFPLFSVAQETICLDFKTGKYQNIVDGKPTGTIIQRDAEYQIEINKERGIQSKDEVQWIDDCSYKLIYMDKSLNYPNLIVKITETGSDYYLFEVSEESNPDKVLKGKNG